MFRHFPPVECQFAGHFFLCDSGRSLENCSSYLYGTRSEDSFAAMMYFPEVVHISQKVSSAACLLSLIQLMVICECRPVFRYSVRIHPFNQMLVIPACPALMLDTGDIKMN